MVNNLNKVKFGGIHRLTTRSISPASSLRPEFRPDVNAFLRSALASLREVGSRGSWTCYSFLDDCLFTYSLGQHRGS